MSHLFNVQEDGLLSPGQDGSAQIYLNMNLATASSKYDWLNSKHIWVTGIADTHNGVAELKGYSN